MLIYRAERGRTGPFWHLADFNALADAMLEAGRLDHQENARQYPSPANDRFKGGTPRNDAGDWYCACSSYQQWKSWFPVTRVRQVLANRGFDLVVYDVPDDLDTLRVGRRQVLFKPEAATVVGRFSPLEDPTLTLPIQEDIRA